MDIEQYIRQISAHILACNYMNNGESESQAIVLDKEAKHVIIQVENEIISSMLDGYWKKVEQSLIHRNDKRYDKITIENILDDGAVKQRVFWFDITECFGS